MRRAIGVVFGLALLGLSGPIARAQTPCSGPPPYGAPPQQVSTVQGYTWSGVLIGFGGTAIQFAVDHVYANGEGGGLAAIDRLQVGTSLLLENLDSPGIDGDGLVISHRYLVSTGALPAFGRGGRYLSISPRDTVVWELEGSTATLVDIYGCSNQAPLPALESARTVAEALALVAPAAVLPPTDTVAPAEVDTERPLAWLALLLGALAGLVYLLRPRLPARP